jgi:hypothetical protein
LLEGNCLCGSRIYLKTLIADVPEIDVLWKFAEVDPDATKIVLQELIEVSPVDEDCATIHVLLPLLWRKIKRPVQRGHTGLSYWSGAFSNTGADNEPFICWNEGADNWGDTLSAQQFACNIFWCLFP